VIPIKLIRKRDQYTCMYKPEQFRKQDKKQAKRMSKKCPTKGLVVINMLLFNHF